jgi:uncharacterized protein (DUF2147 family)
MTNISSLCWSLPLLLALFSTPTLAQRLDISGRWLTADRDGEVEIADCGNNSPCGHLVWYNETLARTRFDARNPNPLLAQRELIGTQIFWGFTRSNGQWAGGYIYNPADGKTFKAHLRRADDGALIVKGCLGPLCVTRRWTRVQT